MSAPEPGDDAFITDADLDSAAEFWARNAPGEYRGLIDPKTPGP